MGEEGHKRVLEEEAWAKDVFPDAHERLKRAAAAIPADAAARPWIAALTELVQAQADTTGFVPLPRWAQIRKPAATSATTSACPNTPKPTSPGH
ncbi:hypothetical protein AB0K09_08020 [Streptomyces sp. NPDC049577]|uniref:hypothetical protein n=1 Tax=Streptomyces sp. NPDC049577 TaxID=3155153 RepID=UPI00342DE481